MAKLDVKRHAINYLSIKDLSHDFDLSDQKWDFFFDRLLKEADYIYFEGKNQNYYDDNFEDALSNLSEEVLFNSGKKHLRILFKINLSHILLSRNRLSKFWSYYQSPCLIFLNSELQEKDLVALVENNAFITEITARINCIALYQEIESDVLWVMGNQHGFAPQIIEML